MEESNKVDFVSPVFLWVSPMEAKLNAKRQEQKSKSATPITARSNSLVVTVSPPSPLIRAKSALQKRMSGAVGDEVHRNRGTSWAS